MQEISGMMGKKTGKGRRCCSYVYVLECRDGSLYAGLTNDLRRRLALHAAGRARKYTRAHPPRGRWRACGAVGIRAAAARLEYAFKDADPRGKSWPCWPHRSKRRRYSLRWRNTPASRCRECDTGGIAEWLT